MFFFNPKLLLLLKRHSLEIYYKGSEKVMDVSFQSSAVRHLEVVKKDEVVKTLADAFKSVNLSRQNAVIVLSDHIVFERLILKDNPEVTQKEIARFYHEVPLEEAHIAKKIMPLKGSVLALAANRELYSLIIEVAREFEWKIKAVIPMTPFAKLAEDANLTPDQVSQILSSEEVFKEADFLSESLVTPEVIEKDKKKDPEESGSKAKNILTLILALFLLSFIVGSLLYFNILKLPFSLPWMNKPVSSSAPESSSSIQTVPSESTVSAQIQIASVSGELNRSGIKIHVLNGSKIPGQANKVKEKLAESGYENVKSGNIEGSETSASSITYSNSLNEAVKGEINTLMDSLIGESKKLEDTLSEFNVLIILGELTREIE